MNKIKGLLIGAICAAIGFTAVNAAINDTQREYYEAVENYTPVQLEDILTCDIYDTDERMHTIINNVLDTDFDPATAPSQPWDIWEFDRYEIDHENGIIYYYTTQYAGNYNITCTTLN